MWRSEKVHWHKWYSMSREELAEVATWMELSGDRQTGHLAMMLRKRLKQFKAPAFRVREEGYKILGKEWPDNSHPGGVLIKCDYGKKK